MSFDPYELDRDYGAQRRVVTEAEYTARTFLWMVLGLLITFGVATALWLTNLTLYALAAFPVLPVVLLVVTLVLDTVWWFKHYTLVYVLTGGGPGSETAIISNRLSVRIPVK